VTGPHATVFLTGTTPVAPADGKWKTPALQQTAASAQELWFITPFGKPGLITMARLGATVATKGYMPSGRTLSSILSPEGRARMGRLATRYNINPEKLDRMTPWYADVTIALAMRDKEGIAQGSPAERFIIASAHNPPKRAFDNLEDDLKLLITTPETEQVYNLEEAMRRDEDPSLNQRYGEAWAAGDEAWILKEREQHLASHAPETYRILQVEPRKRWADKIAALSKGSKTIVVIVDAGNLTGPNGLPTLLRKQGLQVEGP